VTALGQQRGVLAAGQPNLYLPRPPTQTHRFCPFVFRRTAPPPEGKGQGFILPGKSHFRRKGDADHTLLLAVILRLEYFFYKRFLIVTA
jgi:hypothetical protein